ncbi:MAG: hypothetical protein ACE5HY_03250 [Candidatus Hydrothermarchaeales archaeon]
MTRTRTQTHVPCSEESVICRFKTMDGAIPKYGTIGLRVLPDRISWAKIGDTVRQMRKPAKQGRFLAFNLIFDIETGDLLAIIQDAYLQRLRISGTHGAAAKLLAKCSSCVVGILGSGWLAGGVLQGICACYDVECIKVYSPNRENRERFAVSMSEDIGVKVIAVDMPYKVYKGADIIVTCTSSIEPVFRGRSLVRGTHLTSINTLEVDDECFMVSDRVVVSHREGKANEGINYVPAAFAHRANVEIFSRNIQWDRYPELGEVLIGEVPGRSSDDEITFFCNNAGFGAQFGALGGKAYQLAKERGLGEEIDIERWYEAVR